jgi:hypothetical protein
MARTTGAGDLQDPKGQAVAAATLLSLLVVLVAIAGSIGAALITLGAVALAAGGCALVRRSARWPFVASRRVGVAVLGGGLAVAAFGGALAPHPQTAAGQAAAPSATADTQTPSVAQLAAPAPAGPAPALAMTCPIGGTVASPEFGHDVTATAPYSVTIDYGDGDRYTDDDQHLAAIFTHRYSAAGSFTVNAVVTDATGRTASASCMYTWAEQAR